MNFVVKFGSNIILHYRLVDDPIIDIWKEQITKYNASDCCPINHFNGYTTKSNFENRVARLYELANTINQTVTDKIQILPITDIDYTTAMANLAIMHVHFPEMHGDSRFDYLHSILREYNDTIHWIESVLPILYADPSKQFDRLTVNLDFNKVEDTAHIEIPESSYKFFNPYINFGDLHLGYTHVGRHAQEIFFANDLVCPKDQFVPQRRITASAYMYFPNNLHDTEGKRQEYMSFWSKFYEMRGGKDFWGYDIDDPKLAFGVLKIGELDSIFVDNNSYKIPETLEELNIFRSMLVESEVSDWRFE